MLGGPTAPRRDAAAALHDQNPQAEQAPACAFCDRPAMLYCRRCGRGYCPAHGGAFCQICSDPASALPSARVFQAILWGLPICAVLGLIVIFAAPQLPSEHVARSQPTATVFGPAPAPPPASATPATRVYAVQPGDTLQSIATKNGTTVQAIEQLNPGLSAGNLPIGQLLRLPPATP